MLNILTPNAMHADFCIPALQAGKHVIVEKPPEMTLDKTDQMIAAAEANGRKLAVCLQVRMRESIRAIKAAIDTERFGRMLEGDAYMKWFRATEYYLMDDCAPSANKAPGDHPARLPLHRPPPPDGAGQARPCADDELAHPEVALEDTLKAFLTFESGAEGLVEASTALWPGRPPRIEVNGEDGTAITEARSCWPGTSR